MEIVLWFNERPLVGMLDDTSAIILAPIKINDDTITFVPGRRLLVDKKILANVNARRVFK